MKYALCKCTCTVFPNHTNSRGGVEWWSATPNKLGPEAISTSIHCFTFVRTLDFLISRKDFQLEPIATTAGILVAVNLSMSRD